jgi:hypothetical protein
MQTAAIRIPASEPLARSDAKVVESATSLMSQKAKRQKQIYDNGSYQFRHLILVILQTNKRGRDGHDTTTYFVLRKYPDLSWEEEKGFVRDLLKKHHPGLYNRLEAKKWVWAKP